MRHRIAALGLSVAVGLVALPFAPAFLGSAGASSSCPPPSVKLLINPTVSTPTGTGTLPVATGGAYGCVSLGQGVIGGDPLPACPAPGVLAVINAVQSQNMILQGTVICVSPSNPAGPVTANGDNIIQALLNLIQQLLSGLNLPGSGGGGLPIPTSIPLPIG